jgi:3-hydroxyacyl-[acyl-carrier-protein] dehydratase
MTEQRLEFRIAGYEAMFAGHFPGHPIVPGALLLDQVIVQLRAADLLPSGPIEISSAKFVATIAPDSVIELIWQISATGSCRFECLVAGQRAASGVLRATG